MFKRTRYQFGSVERKVRKKGPDVWALRYREELLRHADIRTTMNIYTRAVPECLRKANSKLVRLLLPTGT
jgi:integrase